MNGNEELDSMQWNKFVKSNEVIEVLPQGDQQEQDVYPNPQRFADAERNRTLSYLHSRKQNINNRSLKVLEPQGLENQGIARSKSLPDMLGSIDAGYMETPADPFQTVDEYHQEKQLKKMTILIDRKSK